MNIRNKIILLIITSLSSTLVFAAEYKTLEEKYGYAVGYNIGKNIITKYPGFDKKAFLDAMKDAINKKPASMTPEKMNQAFVDFSKKQQQASLKTANDYIATYKKRKGVKSLSDGMYYKVIKSGKGTSPGATSTVEVHYRGTHINGKEFDSSYKRGKPAKFPLNRVIKGWTIAVQKMKPGDKWEIVIPPELAYGANGSPGGIAPNETLVFEIELLKVL